MTYQQTIYQLIQKNATEISNSPAILDTNNQCLTYQDLLTQIDEVISQLQSWGINKNDKIAIALPNGVEMAVTFLAVTNGAICCPLNPNYRQPEYEFYLSDLNAKALITIEGIAEDAVIVAKKLNIPVINLIPDKEKAGRFTLSNVDNPPRLSNATSLQGEENRTKPEDIALVLHTSGTTSRPKQVPLTHRNLYISAHNISKTLNLTRCDRTLNVMPLFHIHGLMGVLLSSMSVGSSVICTKGFNCQEFLSWLQKLEATWYSAVPTIHQQVLNQGKSQPDIVKDLSLRFIRSSSASLPPQVMAELEKTFNVAVIEAYGMTEASHQMTSNPLPPQPRKPSSVGIPQGLEVAIMNEAGDILTTGEIGEVVIKGDNVTQGYLNNPLANEKAFTNGWFRTGDNGYLDEEGYLFLKGRIKEIINRGGEKIMPLEVDNVAMELTEVYQAVCFAIPHPTLGEDIAMAVVLNEDTSITTSQIREYLFANLADYKIPSQVIIVDEIPKGATGKLQRIGLVEKLKDNLQTNKVLPTNETEEKIVSIWQEVLNLDSISIEDNFFMLGGDSLKGTQVINRINTIFNLNLINVILFQKPTISELAIALEEEMKSNNQAEIDELAEQLQGLSEEEIRELLEE